MLSSRRCHVTAAAALAGAGLIVVTPVAPPPALLNVQARAVQLTADGSALGSLEDLIGQLGAAALPGQTSFPDPVAAYAMLFQDTLSSLQAIGAQFTADPFPILSQIVANQTSALTALGTVAQSSFTELADYFSPAGFLGTSFAGELQSALMSITSGDAQTGFGTLFDAFLVFPLFALLPLLQQIGPYFEMPFNNLAAAVTAFFGDLLGIGLNVLEPPFSLATAFGSVVDDLVSAVQTGNPMGFADTVLAAPATLTDALLNGFDGNSGILTGLIPALLSLRTDIATAITPPADPSLAADVSGLDPSLAADLSALDPSLASDFSPIASDLSSLFAF